MSFCSSYFPSFKCKSSSEVLLNLLAFLLLLVYVNTQACKPSDQLQERWKPFKDCMGSPPTDSGRLQFHAMINIDPPEPKNIDYSNIQCSDLDVSRATKILITAPGFLDSSDDGSEGPKTNVIPPFYKAFNVILVNSTKSPTSTSWTLMPVDQAYLDAFVVSSFMQCLEDICKLEMGKMHVMGIGPTANVAGSVGHLMFDKIPMHTAIYPMFEREPPGKKN